MSNKVDKLFKDKLEGDSLKPSAQAWEKIEAHLGKKNKMVWLRVAAAVALLGVLTFVAVRWSGNYEQPKEQLVKEEKQEPKSEVRRQEPGVRRQEPGVRSQEPGVRRQEAGVRSQEPGVRSQEPGAKEEINKENQAKTPKKKRVKPAAPAVELPSEEPI
jgi:hypothetical protein